ncbi:MAG: DUF86 domain-containing protein [bacterium]|nr:DUF86 domain-containing protein [bacterium]
MILDRDRVLANHILDAADAIQLFISGLSITAFAENDLVKSAVVKKFEIIGEAANKISVPFKEQHAQIPWRDIIGMRNFLIHDYTGIDYEGVWNTIEIHLPALKDALQELRFSEEKKRELESAF